ncbi:hypothetical protein HDC30_004646 [Pseudomonas sp. JAI115]|nr:hypothetical protein [Pseudomonas sp. JAI115]
MSGLLFIELSLILTISQKRPNQSVDLNDRYHLVTSSQVTYRWVKRQAYAMRVIAYVLRLNVR